MDRIEATGAVSPIESLFGWVQMSLPANIHGIVKSAMETAYHQGQVDAIRDEIARMKVSA